MHTTEHGGLQLSLKYNMNYPMKTQPDECYMTVMNNYCSIKHETSLFVSDSCSHPVELFCSFLGYVCFIF